MTGAKNPAICQRQTGTSDPGNSSIGAQGLAGIYLAELACSAANTAVGFLRVVIGLRIGCDKSR